MLTRFQVVAPADVTTGVSFNFTVTALDQFSNPFTTYAGTVHFVTTDGSGTVPVNSTLVAGVRTFSATLVTLGNQTITVNDVATPAITGTSNTIAVQAVGPTCNGVIDLSNGCTFPMGMGLVLL